ncbi:acyl carrier protein [Streptomyces sp. NPDC046887]|uniref:acyl carrier protein n=1 Tax=Streptomyces sp. NPDC046887 TaxID=3155472 RepID=UPI0033C57C20
MSKPTDPAGSGAPTSSESAGPAADRTGDDVFTVFRETIAEVLGTSPDAIVESTDLRADYGIDSLELMSIGAQLERSLNVQISVEDLVRADTVGEAAALLAERTAGRS